MYVVQIDSEIDLGVAPYLDRVLGEAASANAAAVVLEINTPGGRLDAALDMKNALLDSPVPTFAFVNREAYSAGALIAIATERVYMAPGAVLGAATPITGTGETADEKTVSAVRSAFRSTAESRGLDPRVAEAMVDPRVEIPGLIDGGSLLTLTTTEAVQWEYALAVDGLDALLDAEGLSGRPVVETSPGLAEGFVRFITNPVVASLLITLGFLGLLFELQSPGFGLGGAVGLFSLAAFFGGHLLAGLAGWEGVALVLLGVALLALEIFVVPGFGIAGILGIGAFLGGIYISLIGTLPTASDYFDALVVVTAALLMMLIGGYLVLRFLPRRTFGGLVLSTRLPRRENNPERNASRLLSTMEVEYTEGPLKGAQGTAVTDLRPAGAALIHG
ncbi:MAG: nodulation protein NfeD, partial [Dehalococcoidia bacterium]